MSNLVLTHEQWKDLHDHILDKYRAKRQERPEIPTDYTFTRGVNEGYQNALWEMLQYLHECVDIVSNPATDGKIHFTATFNPSIHVYDIEGSCYDDKLGEIRCFKIADGDATFDDVFSEISNTIADQAKEMQLP